VAGLTFGEATDAGGVGLAPGPYDFGIAAAGDDANPLARFGVSVGPRARAFVLAAGSIGGRGAGLRLAVVHTASVPWKVTHVFPN
jgi:hypothetical protein